MKMKRFLLPMVLLFSTLACGTFSIQLEDPTATTDPIAAIVQATLDAMAFSTPDPNDFGPVSPVWLEKEDTISGQSFPAYLSGLSYRDDSIWLIDQNGTAKMVMGQPANGRLSPDGTGFLFSGDSEISDIYYFNMSSGEVSQLTNTPDVYESNYQWWPERSNVIVFNFVPQDENGPWYGYLGAFDFVTSEYRIIDDQHGSGSTFGLSPDGERIAYIEGSQPMIYTWDQGAEPIDFESLGLEYSSYSSPAWSPDGESIAFHAGGGSPNPVTGARGSATVIYSTISKTVRVLHPHSSQGQRGGPEFAWSPDGSWLAVVNPGEVEADVGPLALWVMRPDGSEEHSLGFSTGPIWSPDGNHLIYHQWQPQKVVVVEPGSWQPTAIEELEDSMLETWIFLP